MYDHTDSINTTFRVLRSCKSLESLGNDALLAMISHSIETFSAALHDFDLTLPDYLHAGGQGRPKWVPMTCATACLADNVSQFDMNEDDILSFLKHIHLLYRFDDFLETMPSQYAIEDLASISDIVVNAFAQFESASHFENTGPNSASTGSSFSVLDSGYGDSEGTNLAGSSFLKHAMLDLIRLLQQPAVQAASWYNQRWYHPELRQLLLAMVQQLSDNSAYKESRRSQQRTPSGNANLRMWLHTTGATSVGTKYQFAFLACLISARDQVPYLRGVEQRYLAQTFAQHVSASWRIWNDIGGRVRDEEEEALTSCIFADKSDIQSLMHLANFEAECAILAQTRLSDLKSDGSNHWRCLEFFRQAVQISGEIYMAGDPTRS